METNENIDDFEGEEFGLDDLIEAEEREQAESKAEEQKPDNSEVERARAFAEKINAGFLFGVNKLVCPSVDDIDELIDRESGTQALMPLALEMGGTMPPWLAEMMAKYDPYIKAGAYMGMTIYSASKAEKLIRAQVEEAQNADESSGGENGTE